MMTVSAVSRLIPNPPARVERRNAKSGDPGALKCMMAFFRISELTVPMPSRQQPAFRSEWERHTIEPLVLITTEAHIIGQDIQDADHLTEDEHAMSVHLESSEELVQQDHLARIHHDALESLLLVLGDRFSAIEEVRMIRRLLQLDR